MSQIKRASVSIMLNIAEGAERRTNKDFKTQIKHLHKIQKRMNGLMDS